MFELQGATTVAGRVLLSAIFLMSAVGNKIPNFNAVAGVMESVGIPAPHLLLAGAIVFLVVGSVSLIVGYKARFGAVLLATFLALASFYFHAFWNFEGQAQQEQMIHFLKNLSMMGAMLFIFANGAGTMSIDAWLSSRAPAQAKERALKAAAIPA